MGNLSEKCRRKALESEKAAKAATDYATQLSWTEIAIEWHALAYRNASEASKDLESRTV